MFVSHPFYIVHGLLTPRPARAPENKHAADMLHHTAAFNPPENIFASVDFCILPPCFVSLLQTFFQTFLNNSALVEHVSQDLQAPFQWELCRPSCFSSSSPH